MIGSGLAIRFPGSSRRSDPATTVRRPQVDGEVAEVRTTAMDHASRSTRRSIAAFDNPMWAIKAVGPLPIGARKVW